MIERFITPKFYKYQCLKFGRGSQLVIPLTSKWPSLGEADKGIAFICDANVSEFLYGLVVAIVIKLKV